MKKQKWLVFFVALALIAGTAGLLNRLKASQRLGEPGIKSAPIPGSLNRKIDLPERVLEFTSTNVPEPELVLRYLPPTQATLSGITNRQTAWICFQPSS